MGLYRGHIGGTVPGMSVVLGPHPREIHDEMEQGVVVGIAVGLEWFGSGSWFVVHWWSGWVGSRVS